MPAGGERVHDDFVVAGEFAAYRGGAMTRFCQV